MGIKEVQITESENTNFVDQNFKGYDISLISHKNQIAIEKSAEFFINFNKSYRILYASSIFEFLMEIQQKSGIGKRCSELTVPDKLILLWEDAIDFAIFHL